MFTIVLNLSKLFLFEKFYFFHKSFILIVGLFIKFSGLDSGLIDIYLKNLKLPLILMVDYF